jgi:nucleotide-binding universal stress UspA family protein
MFQRILCATDFSDTAEAAWAAARELAGTHRSELVLAHIFTELPVYPEVAVIEVQRVWEDQRAWVERALGERVAAAAAQGLAARWVLKTGMAPESIAEIAVETRADLIVIGTHGRTGLTRLVIGSVAERVVRLAPCPVLTVKPPEVAREAAEAAGKAA